MNKKIVREIMIRKTRMNSEATKITDENIIEQINEIKYLKNQIAEISEQKANLERAVAASLEIKDSVNSTSKKYSFVTEDGEAVEFTIGTSSSIKIENLDGLREFAEDLIDTKYQCNKSRFAKLLKADPALANKVSDFIIVTPLKPTFTFKKGE